jgi:hypothetical protein
MAILTLAATPTWSAASCSAKTSATVAPVIELYTSEGCSSCPPADQWLSKWKGEPDVVALAFHVDYWDRLGWKDRFASPAYTQRQAQQQLSNGARFSYTPQVVIDGIDRPRWHSTDAPAAARGRAPASVDIQLTREGTVVEATVHARPGAPARLAAYWAVTEHDHVTPVKAGENEGATLRHDFVVRRFAAVAPWNTANTANPAPALFRFDAELAQAAAQPRFVNLVVIDAVTQKPVQALKLGC